MAQGSEDILTFGDFSADERRKFFGPGSRGVEFLGKQRDGHIAEEIADETSGVGDNDRKPVTCSQTVRTQSPESASTESKSKECFDANQQQSGDMSDSTASRTDSGSSSLPVEIESTEPVNSDFSVSSGGAAASVVSSEVIPLVHNSMETQPLMSDKKTEAQPKPKPSSWAALFQNTPPQTSIIGGKSGHVTFSPHSMNYPSSKADSRDTVVLMESRVVSVAEDPVAISLAKSILNWEISHKPIPLIPRGLVNKGNLCYINATMQTLLCCPPFYNLLMLFDCKAVVDRQSSSTPIIDALVRFANEFCQGSPLATKATRKALSQDLKQEKAFEPLYIYSMLHKIKSQLSLRGRQEDAEEFLSCLLDGLHEEMLKLQQLAGHSKFDDREVETNDPREASVAPSQEQSVDSDNDEEEWEEVGPKNKSSVTRSVGFETSPISQIYGGLLRSSVQMQGCKESVTLEPFFTLKLDIQDEDIWSVKDALEALASKEALHGFTSSKTGQEVDASKRLTLAQLPPILILHLKRFLYDKQGGCQKLQKEIDYTAELEVNRDFLAEVIRKKLSAAQRTYRLFSVIYHHGKHATGGHYTCDVYHHGLDGWLRFDDSLIKRVSEQQVLKHVAGRVAYLLYFKRCDLS
jgi:ubiquitin carboxyl-terminal hydrolase 10